MALLALQLAPLAAAQTPEQTLACTLETCLPDFIPSNPREDATDERYPVKFCTDLLNLGDGPAAGHFRVLLYVDDVPIAERQVDDVIQKGEGNRAPICWEGIMLVWGRHNFTVHIDSNDEIREKSEDNNRARRNFWVAPTPRQDLTVALSVLPKVGKPNSNQIFVMNVTNLGTNASDPTFVELTDENGRLAKLPVPAIAPGKSFTAAHVTRPDTRPVGEFLARAVVDPDGTVPELRESNNVAIEEYEVAEHPAPDIVLRDALVQGNLTARRGVRIDATVENVGNRLVRGMGVSLFDEEDVLLGNASTAASLYPGVKAKVQFIVVLPAGNHTLRLTADPLGRVPELNETNNDAFVDVVIVDEPRDIDAPNLVIERLFTLVEDPRANESVAVGALIHNAGVNKSNATIVRFTVDDKTLAQAPVPVLRPGAYHTAYVTWPTGAADAYVLAAEVDPQGTLLEIADDDNKLEIGVLVEARPPPAEEEPPAPTPPTPPPVNETPPTPTTPTPPTPGETGGARIVLGELILGTKQVPGGLKGVVSASLRNPNIEPLGLVTVTFRVDDKLLKEVLVQGVRGAATTAASTGEVELPPGKHKVSAEVRILGSSEPSLKREREYDVGAGGEDGVPAPGVLALVAVAALVALTSRRWGLRRK